MCKVADVIGQFLGDLDDVAARGVALDGDVADLCTCPDTNCRRVVCFLAALVQGSAARLYASPLIRSASVATVWASVTAAGRL